VVKNIALGNCCHQILKLLPSVRSGEIILDSLGDGKKARNAIEENLRAMLKPATAFVHMQSVNLVTPSLHGSQELTLPIFGGTLGGGYSLQFLRL